MTKSSSDSGSPRPFSFRPQDFGAPEPPPKSESGLLGEADGKSEEVPPASFRSPDVEPTGSAGRASTHARPSGDDDSYKVQPKKDQTILMAVPPPAQENKGE